MINVDLIKKIFKGKLEKKNLLLGLTVSMVKGWVCLYYQSETDKKESYKLAVSQDGLEFQFFKNLKKVDLKKENFEKYEQIILPRKDFFDDKKIEIEGHAKIPKGTLIVYHTQDSAGVFRVGVALLDKNNKTSWRCTSAIWESSTKWIGKEVKFIGLAFSDGRLIGYWNVDDQAIYAVIYPSFKARSPETANNLSVDLQRVDHNPIIKPLTENAWEDFNTFNPAAVYVGNKVHILYRAQGRNYVSVVGYATSTDGITIEKRHPRPIYFPKEPFEFNGNKRPKNISSFYGSGGGYGGVEDPRITLIDNRIYMTYVAHNGITPPRIALTSIAVDDFLNQRWLWEKAVLISPPGVVDKGPAVFPEKINGNYVIMHRIFPNILIDFVPDLAFDGQTRFLQGKYKIETRPGAWDGGKIGTGAPPIKTKDGWLLIYYGTPYDYELKPGAYNPYLIGAMLLDLNDPTKVLHRSVRPILSPTEHYENNGFKAGVVFPCGAVVINETLFVYYGGADSYVCVATANLNQFLKQLKYTEDPVLEPTKIVKVI